MKLTGFILLLCAIALSFRTIEDEKNDIILPQTIHENEEVTIYAIKDSINIDSDSLFFHIDLFMQDMSYIKGYVPIIDGKAKFTMPKNAALFMGYFYSIDDRASVTYIRRIHDKKGKVVRNAYQHAYEARMNKDALKKELSNHPTNLIAYAQYISYLSELYSYGKMSDTLFMKEVKESLKKVEKKVNNKEESDLAALASLYSYNKQFDKSKETLYKLLNNYPNSSFLNVAFSSYISGYSLHNDGKSDDDFMESFIQTAGKYNPQSSFGRSQMHGVYIGNKWITKGFYKDEDIIANNNYIFQYMDSTSDIHISANIEAYIHRKDYENARKWANFILQEGKKGKWLHNTPFTKQEREILNTANNINFFIAYGYSLLRYVETEAGEFESALSYTDSALYFSNKDEVKKYMVNFYRFRLDDKAYLQRKINQPYEALKTYEILYQETKEESVLDSIKILFKEIEQEESFESYAKNLKEAVESSTQEPKKLAADFSIKDMSGYEIKLSEWKGRVVVLNFWANYCQPCIEEIPLLNQLWKENQTKDIIFLAITNDSPLVVQRFAQKRKEMFSFSVLPNAKEISNVYSVKSLPTTIVINKKGEIVHKESGFGGDIDKLKQVVLEELKK